MEFVHVIKNILPSNFCKSIIDKFEVDNDKHQGRLGLGYVNLNIKKTLDLHIGNRKDWDYITDPLGKYLANGLQEYFLYLENQVFKGKGLKIVEKIFGDNIKVSGFQIQKYEKDDHFYWHTDDSSVEKRLLAYIIYLNTVPKENGGSTDFLNGKSIQPEEGSILIFPSTWSYVHRGKALKSGEKYIITGFIVQSNLKVYEQQPI
jgi:hypothetical protein